MVVLVALAVVEVTGLVQVEQEQQDKATQVVALPIQEILTILVEAEVEQVL
ncbi:hypothetical protein N9159_00560 [bacterium]|nr:hypothetical protein [bacterium]